MTRCHHCHSRLTQDEVMYYGSSCNSCEGWLMRRWDDLESGRRSMPVPPRMLGNILFCLIAAGIFVAFMYCMWMAVGGGR